LPPPLSTSGEDRTLGNFRATSSTPAADFNCLAFARLNTVMVAASNMVMKFEPLLTGSLIATVIRQRRSFAGAQILIAASVRRKRGVCGEAILHSEG
jgi:hypothetical protein